MVLVRKETLSFTCKSAEKVASLRLETSALILKIPPCTLKVVPVQLRSARARGTHRAGTIVNAAAVVGAVFDLQDTLQFIEKRSSGITASVTRLIPDYSTRDRPRRKDR